MQGDFSSIQNDMMFQKQINYALAHEKKESVKRNSSKSQSRSLDQIPEAELETRLELLKAQMLLLNNEKQSNKVQRMKSKISIGITAIEGELMRRKSESESPVIANAPEKEAEQVQGVGTNVGLGALVTGIVGYMTGSYLGKNPWAYAVGGAVTGAAVAYGITKYKQKNSGEKSAPSKFTPTKS